MPRDNARALLIDFDGVLRRWDPAPMIATEVKYGLKPASLLETSMSWDIYRPAMAGEITDAEWMQLVAQRLPLEEKEAAAAVAEWQEYRGETDPEALALVRQVRAAGIPVGLSTNATDRLRGDLELLGLTGEFDVIVNSSEIKIHKPAPEYFAEAVKLIGVAPKHVMVVDDDDRVIAGARSAKLYGYRWTGPEHVPYLIKAFGIEG